MLVEALSHSPPFSSLNELKAHLRQDWSTHGIAIQAWRASHEPELNFNVFDFAGQPVYHSSHRNFLAQEQAVYLVVFRADRPYAAVKMQVRRWLNLIGSQIDQQQREHFVNGHMRRPAVVVIGTHADLCTPKEQEDYQAWYRYSLYQSNDYESVLDLHPWMLFINHDIPSSVDALRKLIIEKGLKQLEKTPLGLAIFEKLFPLLDEIRKMKIRQPPFLSIDEFKSLMMLMQLKRVQSTELGRKDWHDRCRQWGRRSSLKGI